MNVRITKADQLDVALEVCGWCKERAKSISPEVMHFTLERFAFVLTINWVKSNNCGKETDIGLCQAIASQVLATIAENLLYTIEVLRGGAVESQHAIQLPELDLEERTSKSGFTASS